MVPDLESLSRAYLAHIAASERDRREAQRHDEYVAAMFEQCVRRQATGTSRQPAVRRLIETAIRGDARRQGETHQWMYDRINLGMLLVESGYRNVRTQRHDTSQIPHWTELGLDLNERGEEYIPQSLYMEAQK